MQKLVTNIFFVNVLCDVLLLFIDQVAILRVLFMLFVILTFLVKYKGRHGHYSGMIILVCYTILLIPFSRFPEMSILASMRILLPMFGLMVGFHFFNTESRILALAKSVKWALLLLVVNFVFANAFGLGESTYTSGNSFLLGALTNNWGLFTYSVLFFPLILLTDRSKTEKIVSLFAIFFNVALVVLSITRVAIFVMVLGSIMIFMLSYSFKRRIRVLAFASIVLIAVFPLVDDMIFDRVEARQNRFEKGALEKEGRYLETFYVWNKVVQFESPAHSIFGLEAFNSVGNYGPSKSNLFRYRNLHVDYNLIVNTIGILGLILYFAMYIQIGRRYILYSRSVKVKTAFQKKLSGVFITFFVMQFVTSFGGAMHQISLRLIIYLTLGAALGYYFQQFKNSRKVQSSEPNPDKLSTANTPVERTNVVGDFTGENNSNNSTN